MAKIYHSLKDKKEKKLNIDYKLIEKITEKFLQKYNIDQTIDTFVYQLLDQKLNKSITYDNLQYLLTSKGKYQIQITHDDFEKMKKFVYKTIKENIEKDLGSIDEDKKELYQTIYNNLFKEIQLTLFDEGIQRLTLVAFHYLLKNLEIFAKNYLQEFNVSSIKRTKNPLELFLQDLMTVISHDEEMKRFLLTLKSLIEQWLIKYNAKTKIGEFYYDILMITPDHIIEKILKYLLFTAIKNKNPLTLRAIFSSYLTLIHQNLFSFYATNLSKVKVGYFKQLEGLFAENFNLIFESEIFNLNKFIIDSMLYTFIMDNKRLLKNNYYLFSDNDFIQNIFETNYFELIQSYKTSFELLDYSFMYMTILKNIDFNFEYSKYYKINNRFFKNSNKKKFQKFLYEKLIEEYFNIFYSLIGDKETVLNILESISKDLNKKFNKNNYLDQYFRILNINDKKFLKDISNLITILREKTESHLLKSSKTKN